MKELSLFQLPAYSLFFQKNGFFQKIRMNDSLCSSTSPMFIHRNQSISLKLVFNFKFRQPDFVNGSSIHMVETVQCTIGFQPDFFLQKLLRHFISYTLGSAGEP